MELGQQCSQNVDRWKAQADSAIARALVPPESIHEFRRLLEDAAMSTNVSADKILTFDRLGFVASSRAIAIFQGESAVPAIRPADSLRTWHRLDWSARRSAFERLWTHGRRMVYGALNIGGRGTLGRYGPFCLVVTEPTRLASQSTSGVAPRVGLFPSDTAQTYTDASARVDARRAAADVACWESRADIAICKHVDDLKHVDTDKWADMVCRPDHYIEVCVADLVAITDVNVIRVTELPRRVRSLAYARPSTLTAVERCLAEAHTTIERWHILGIRIEVSR